jgi:hypothetical protein
MSDGMMKGLAKPMAIGTVLQVGMVLLGRSIRPSDRTSRSSDQHRRHHRRPGLGDEPAADDGWRAGRRGRAGVSA